MAEEFIRTPTRVSGAMTAEEEAKFKEVAAYWSGVANATGPRLTQETGDELMRALYRAAKLDEPKAVAVVHSPIILAVAQGIAGAWWELHEEKRDISPGTLPSDLSKVERAILVAFLACTYAAAGIEAPFAVESVTWDEREPYYTVLSAECVTRLITVALGEANLALGKTYIRQWRDTYQGGNAWASYLIYIAASRDVLGLRLPEFEAYQAWENAARVSGFRNLYPQFCMVCDLPTEVHVDDQFRPHNESGPSKRWIDGWSTYHIQGVSIPPWFVEEKEKITAKKVMEERDIERRRVLLKLLGVSKFMVQAGAEKIGTDDFGTLYRMSFPPDEDIVAVEVVNATAEADGSFERYFIPVDPSCYGGDAGRIPQAAVASSFRNKDGSLHFADWRKYDPAIES